MCKEGSTSRKSRRAVSLALRKPFRSNNAAKHLAISHCAKAKKKGVGVQYVQSSHQQEHYHQQHCPNRVSTDASSTACNSFDSITSQHPLCPVTNSYSDILEEYHINPAVIGKGHYGSVRECFHRTTCQSFAVKSIEKSNIRLDHLQREVSLLASMNHPSIMKMVDCYEDADYLHIVTEKYSGGEVFDKIVERTTEFGCFSEARAAMIIKSLLEAVNYLHHNGIVHRDIKPENILFETDQEDDSAIKLIDFGLSTRHEKGDLPMTNPVGTAYYQSPELLKGQYDHTCDNWSIGIVAYVLLCGYPPFNGSTDDKIEQAIKKGHFHFSGPAWALISSEAKDFINCLLMSDPKKRFTTEEALDHPWIRIEADSVRNFQQLYFR